jgi:beta-glucosidase
MQEDVDRKFPHGFMWGASTAAHQVEGGNHNQWTVWELSQASEKAKTAAERYSYLQNWDQIKKQAEKPENYVSGRGVEHFSRYQEDFDILEKLNLNSFRFGVEWSRLEPEEGKWDEEAVEH